MNSSTMWVLWRRFTCTHAEDWSQFNFARASSSWTLKSDANMLSTNLIMIYDLKRFILLARVRHIICYWVSIWTQRHSSRGRIWKGTGMAEAPCAVLNNESRRNLCNSIIVITGHYIHRENIINASKFSFEGEKDNENERLLIKHTETGSMPPRSWGWRI